MENTNLQDKEVRLNLSDNILNMYNKLSFSHSDKLENLLKTSIRNAIKTTFNILEPDISLDVCNKYDVKVMVAVRVENYVKQRIMFVINGKGERLNNETIIESTNLLNKYDQYCDIVRR